MNALRDPKVGQYVNRHFVSAFQKVATFRIEGGAKQGGNVAAYFCTPDGRVLHALAGPVDAKTFLREARWAQETFQLAELDKLKPPQMALFFRKAHLERLSREHRLTLTDERLPRPDLINGKSLDDLLVRNRLDFLDENAKVHLLLGVGAAPNLDQVYQVVFERILNEKIATAPVVVAGR